MCCGGGCHAQGLKPGPPGCEGHCTDGRLQAHLLGVQPGCAAHCAGGWLKVRILLLDGKQACASLELLLLGCLEPAGSKLHVQMQQGCPGRCRQLLGTAVSSVARPPAELFELVRLLLVRVLVAMLCGDVFYLCLAGELDMLAVSCRYDCCCCAPGQHHADWPCACRTCNLL